jgi:hypothetical protein
MELRDYTNSLIKENITDRKMLMGFTENFDLDYWSLSFDAICEALSDK